MSLPKVVINIQNGQLGRVDDLGNGVPGLIVLMASSPTGHAFGAVKAYSNFDDLPAEMKLVKGIELYFLVAPGYKVYIMPVANTTAIADAVNVAHLTTPYAKQLVEAGGGEIRFIGIVGTLLLANLAICLTNSQALAVHFAELQNPVAVILPYSYADADTVVDLTLGTDNRVAVCVSFAGDEIGLLLGRLASIPVSRHIGKVADGAMPIVDALLDGNSDPEVKIEEDMTTVGTLHDKGYIVLGVYIGKAGYFFMGHPMACAKTDDYATLVNRRTIDKGQIIAYSTYLEEINNEVFVDADGKLQPGYVKQMQALVENAINLQMANELSNPAKAFFDDQQNVIETSKVTGTVKMQPVGHSSEITINLGLTNTI